MKVKLLEGNFNLLERKNELQSRCFALSKMQDTKPSSFLYNLGNNIKKSEFSSREYEDANTIRLDSLAKVFAVSIP